MKSNQFQILYEKKKKIFKKKDKKDEKKKDEKFTNFTISTPSNFKKKDPNDSSNSQNISDPTPINQLKLSARETNQKMPDLLMVEKLFSEIVVVIIEKFLIFKLLLLL